MGGYSRHWSGSVSQQCSSFFFCRLLPDVDYIPKSDWDQPIAVIIAMKNRNDNNALFQKVLHGPEWQGFIYEHDGVVNYFSRHHEHTIMTEAAVTQLSSLEASKHYQASEPYDQAPLPKLKPITKPQKPSKPVHRSTEKRRLPVSKLPAKKPIAFSSRRPLPNLFSRVPIVRIEEKLLGYGTVVYRGMMPRTSDRYFNTLKEVDYAGAIADGHTKDRPKQPLTFNSKFQCGNLNYAVRAFTLRLRI